jgi:hypothetical protein
MPRNTPEYFQLLTESDQLGYHTLQREVLSLTENHRRGLRAAIFTEALDLVRAWAQRGDADDWKRCLVCGLFHLNARVAVNARQLAFLTGRCKSAVNGALKLMRYVTVSARGDVNPDLVCALPILKGNTPALRQWSVRRREAQAAGKSRTDAALQSTEALWQEMEPNMDGSDNLWLWQDDAWSWDRFL